MFQPIDNKKKLAELEKEILAFWNENKIFEKSLENRKDAEQYSFYDGPPFITGVPHWGTLLSSVVKDCFPRFWTMKGYQVERRWGWDCHGLPAEHMVEKKLGTKSKKDIEDKVGIEKFNQTCFEETSRIAGEWEDVIGRIGRWVEFRNAYKTMDKDYMESVWWAFKQLYDKKLVYEDVRISLYCPRCATPLSNFEIAMDNSYQEDTDPTVYVKMKAKDWENTYFLVWTTTPWTLLANVALAVGSNIKYQVVSIRNGEEKYILAEDRITDVMKDEKYEVIEEIEGSDLVGRNYEAVFKSDIQDGYKVVSGDFVTAEDGTGIVHIAPAFGEDDFNLRKEKGLPIILNVDEAGKFIDGEWKGKNVWDANKEIVQWLEENKYLFKTEEVTHSYPHCYRCHSKMIYKAQPAWFVNIATIRKKLLEKNQEINWFPKHLKEGRFQKGIESAPDWNISRDRYWGTAMPVWKCEEKDCKNIKIIGSYDELEKLSEDRLDDYHRPKIDGVTFKCDECGGIMKRIPQIFDCWLESGSMPFAQFHYPFENKEKFEKSFPTDFISEYVPQTRAWFYLLHVISVAIFDQPAFKNVVVTGTIAGSDGRKMSKSLGNFTAPDEVLEKYSADALRFYFLSSPLMSAQDMNFSEKDIAEIQRGVFMRLWNSVAFFNTYAVVDNWEPKDEVEFSKNLLDKWIISKLNSLIKTVNDNMVGYDVVKATRAIPEFIDNLSNWYIRRSRRRFWKSESDEDKNSAYQTLYTVLLELSKVMAPFTPFIAEIIYRNLSTPRLREAGLSTTISVHLENFPVADESLIDEKLNDQMSKTRKIVELGLAARAKAGIKVRQPLGEMAVNGSGDLPEELVDLVRDEINIKKFQISNFIPSHATGQEFQKTDENNADDCKCDGVGANPCICPRGKITIEDGGISVCLGTEITEELRVEGVAREIVRSIQQARKEAGLEIDDRINVSWSSDDKDIKKAFSIFGEYIAREVLAEKIGGNLEGVFSFEKENKNWSLKICRV